MLLAVDCGALLRREREALKPRKKYANADIEDTLISVAEETHDLPFCETLWDIHDPSGKDVNSKGGNNIFLNAYISIHI